METPGGLFLRCAVTGEGDEGEGDAAGVVKVGHGEAVRDWAGAIESCGQHRERIAPRESRRLLVKMLNRVLTEK